MLYIWRGVLLLLFPALLLCCGEVERDDDAAPGDSGQVDTQSDRLRGEALVADTGAGDGPAQEGVVVQDAGPPAKAAFAWGGLTSGGSPLTPPASGTTVLLEGGFESLSTICASTKSLCVTGGIVP